MLTFLNRFKHFILQLEHRPSVHAPPPLTCQRQLTPGGYSPGWPGLVTTPLVAVVEPPQTALTDTLKPLLVTELSVLNWIAAWLLEEVKTVPRCLQATHTELIDQIESNNCCIRIEPGVQFNAD